MLYKIALEQLIAAWPDENGYSSNPEIYDAWLERERRYDARSLALRVCGTHKFTSPTI
jgi:hypothetical protein